ncbi:hypothetical protein EYR36_010037 [Pleurotus pulmonarius]|nr:hypothetical protein EYR36_010037 [Pleurotus pulmonarius]
MSYADAVKRHLQAGESVVFVNMKAGSEHPPAVVHARPQVKRGILSPPSSKIKARSGCIGGRSREDMISAPKLECPHCNRCLGTRITSNQGLRPKADTEATGNADGGMKLGSVDVFRNTFPLLALRAM